ncbi:MAG: hypothetical protein AAFN09_17310 [Pseudomonadota bacterium]
MTSKSDNITRQKKRAPRVHIEYDLDEMSDSDPDAAKTLKEFFTYLSGRDEARELISKILGDPKLLAVLKSDQQEDKGAADKDTVDKSIEVIDDKEKKEQNLLNLAAELTPYMGDRKAEVIEPPHKRVGIDEELTDFEKRVVWKLRQTELSKPDETAIERSITDIVHAVMRDNGQRLVLLKAPMLWKERDKSLGQQPHEFIQTTYFDAGHNVDRATLRKLDRTLLLSLERQERDPEKAPPQDFLDRLPRKRDTVDAEVAYVKETGQRPTSYTERMRLEQAARRRGTTLGKE